MQAKKANNNAVIDNLIAHFKKEKMHKTVSQCTTVRFEKKLFRLFPIISISQNFLIIFFLTLEKIGIDENGILLP